MTVARPRTYRADIDGLRSIAILTVVLYHCGVRWIPGGFSGVDVFFVISGYLIGGHIYGDLRVGRFSFLGFYGRRAKRILPALYCVLFAALLVGTLLLSPHELTQLTMYSGATVLSASNVLLWKKTGYFSANANLNPLLMTWSLGVEEQFYLVVPCLLVVMSKVRRRLLLPFMGMLIAVSLALSVYQVSRYPVASFYLLPSRMWELASGVTLAIIESRRHRQPWLQSGKVATFVGLVGIALIALPNFILTTATQFPGLAAVPSVLGAVLVIATGGGQVNRWVLSSSPLVFIGKISYSWYLWHWPILAILRVIRGGPLPISWGLSVVAVSFCIAVISYYAVELPFRTSKRLSGSLLLRYGSVSLIILTLCGLIWRSNGMEWRYPSVASIERNSMNLPNDPCLIGYGRKTPALFETCLPSKNGMKRIALWGDSHAAAIAPGVRSLATRQGYVTEEYTKTACPPLIGVSRVDPQDPALPNECAAFNRTVVDRLIAEPYVTVVVLEASWSVPLVESWSHGMKRDPLSVIQPSKPEGATATSGTDLLGKSALRTIQELHAAGKHVVVFGDVPTFETDPIWRMRSSGIYLRHMILKLLNGKSAEEDPGLDEDREAAESHHAADRTLHDVTQSQPGSEFLDLKKVLCSRGGACKYRDGATALYSDNTHLSARGGLMALEGWRIEEADVEAPLRPSSYQ